MVGRLPVGEKRRQGKEEMVRRGDKRVV